MYGLTPITWHIRLESIFAPVTTSERTTTQTYTRAGATTTQAKTAACHLLDGGCHLWPRQLRRFHSCSPSKSMMTTAGASFVSTM